MGHQFTFIVDKWICNPDLFNIYNEWTASDFCQQQVQKSFSHGVVVYQCPWQTSSTFLMQKSTFRFLSVAHFLHIHISFFSFQVALMYVSAWCHYSLAETEVITCTQQEMCGFPNQKETTTPYSCTPYDVFSQKVVEKNNTVITSMLGILNDRTLYSVMYIGTSIMLSDKSLQSWDVLLACY